MAAFNDNNNIDGQEEMDFQGIDQEEDEDLAVGCSSSTDTKFDVTIGHIEDIIMEDEFQEQQRNFLEKYYTEFEDTEENKFVYTDIHREYISLIENHLNEELCKRMSDFSMPEFSKQLFERKNELEGEIFEMLLTFSDFMTFKEMFLDYKAEKEGRTVDLSGGLMVTPLPDDLSINGESLQLFGQSFPEPQ